MFKISFGKAEFSIDAWSIADLSSDRAGEKRRVAIIEIDVKGEKGKVKKPPMNIRKIIKVVLFLLILGFLAWCSSGVGTAFYSNELRVIKTIVLVDPAFAERANWQEAASRLINLAAAPLEKEAGIKFSLEEFAAFTFEAGATLEAVAAALDKQLVKEEETVVIGLVAATASKSPLFGFSLFSEGIAIVKVLENEALTVRALLHELAHLFGAVHVADPDSVLDLWNRGENLDRVNLALIRLFRERSFSSLRYPLSREKREEVRSLYQEIAASLRRLEREMRAKGDSSFRKAPNLADDVYLNLAHLELEERNYEAVLNCCQEALRLNSDAVEALNLMGIARRRQGAIDEAIAIYRKILERQPQEARVLYNLGIALAKQGKLKDALQAYEQALKIRPRMVEAMGNQADVLLRLGREKEAEDILMKALAINSRFALGYANLAEVYFRREENDRATEMVNRALALEPDLPEAHNMKGKILHRQGRVEEAMKEFSLALKFDPTQAKAAHNLGNCYLELNRLQEAKNYFELAQKLAPSLAEAYEGLGTCLLLMKDTAAAIFHLRRARELGLNSLGLQLNLSTALIYQQKWAEAAEAAQEALRLEPKSSLAWNNLGLLALQEKDWSQAEKYFRQALLYDSRNKQALANLAALLLALNRWAEAAATYEQLLKESPGEAISHNNLAVAYYHLKDYRQAWAHIQQALSLGLEVNREFMEAVKKQLKD